MESSEKQKYPIGTGSEFFDERKKERLPALEVKNTVVKANPAFKDSLPFRIKLGQPTELGIFFTNYPENYPEEKIRAPIIVPEAVARSGIVGSVVFKDRDGLFYRDIDVKGIGVFRNVSGVRIVSPITPKRAGGEAYGLMDYHYALRDWDFSEKFVKAGIRTHRDIAIIDLDEIIFDSKKIIIEEAKKRGIIPPEIHPVVLVRAFGTKERIDFLEDIPTSKRAHKSLVDAKAIVAQELQRDPEKFSVEEYLGWFADTLGRQIARLCKRRWFHGYLTPHNITLDCRIVDLDSVMTDKEAMMHDDVTRKRLFPGSNSQTRLHPDLIYQYDYDRALYVLRTLVINAERLLSHDVTSETRYDAWWHYRSIFKAAYEDELQKLRRKPGEKKNLTVSG